MNTYDYSSCLTTLGPLRSENNVVSSLDCLSDFVDKIYDNSISGSLELFRNNLSIEGGSYIQTPIGSTDARIYGSENVFAHTWNTSYGDSTIGTRCYCILSIYPSENALLISGDFEYDSLSATEYDGTTFSDVFANSNAAINYIGPDRDFSNIQLSDIGWSVSLYQSFASFFGRLVQIQKEGSNTKLYFDQFNEIATSIKNKTSADYISWFYGIDGRNMLYAPFLPKIGNTEACLRLQHAEGTSVRAIQTAAHAEGRDSLANGWNAHAEGQMNVAGGVGAHAEGLMTIAKKNYDHAEGSVTKANGGSSHAEGSYTQANGEKSHAEGLSCIANGNESHAEGNVTIAAGIYSHAEGNQTSAFGNTSHAEGVKTYAFNYAHAEGNETSASAASTHAEGNKTKATNTGSHAEGNATTAAGTYSHSEGNLTLAQGGSSHAEGNATSTFNAYAHSEGNKTLAYGSASHAEGNETLAYPNYSHAEGSRTVIAGRSTINYGHAEGYDTIAYQTAAHAEGTSETTSISATCLDDNRTLIINELSSISAYNVVFVRELSATGVFEVTNVTASDGHSYIKLNAADARLSSYSQLNCKFFKGGAGGQYAHAEGKNTWAKGNFSHTEGELTQAKGVGAHAEGLSTLASGIQAHAEGDKTTASGAQAHAEGQLTKATGICSHAEGLSTTASGKYSHAAGHLATANKERQYVWNGLSTAYTGKGAIGSFNVNPEGGISGFYIGNDNFSKCVANAIVGMSQTDKDAIKAALGL